MSTATFRRTPHTAWRRIADETLVVDLAGHCLFGLDPAGGTIWEQLDTWRTVDQLAAVSSASVSAVARFLSELLEAGLVESQGLAESETLVAQPIDPRDSDQQSSPCIVWREEIAQVAASCAFLPGQNVLCNTTPFQ